MLQSNGPGPRHEPHDGWQDTHCGALVKTVLLQVPTKNWVAEQLAAVKQRVQTVSCRPAQDVVNAELASHVEQRAHTGVLVAVQLRVRKKPSVQDVVQGAHVEPVLNCPSGHLLQRRSLVAVTSATTTSSNAHVLVVRHTRSDVGVGCVKL